MNGGYNLEDDSEDDVPTVLTSYEWEGSTEPSSDVVDGIAQVLGRDPESMPVLQETVEVDALNALVSTDVSERGRVAVSFTYGETAITVSNRGTVIVDTDPGPEP